MCAWKPIHVSVYIFYHGKQQSSESVRLEYMYVYSCAHCSMDDDTNEKNHVQVNTMKVWDDLRCFGCYVTKDQTNETVGVV